MKLIYWMKIYSFIILLSLSFGSLMTFTYSIVQAQHNGTWEVIHVYDLYGEQWIEYFLALASIPIMIYWLVKFWYMGQEKFWKIFDTIGEA